MQGGGCAPSPRLAAASNVWYDREEIVDLFVQYASVSVAAKRVPISALVRDVDAFEEYARDLKANRAVPCIEKPATMLQYLFLNEPEAQAYVIDHGVSERKKSSWEPFEVERRFWEGVVDNASLRALRDLKDYGDNDEMALRQVFQRGGFRIELNIPNKDGVLPKTPKVLYWLPYEDSGIQGVDWILVPFNLDTDMLGITHLYFDSKPPESRSKALFESDAGTDRSSAITRTWRV